MIHDRVRPESMMSSTISTCRPVMSVSRSLMIRTTPERLGARAVGRDGHPVHRHGHRQRAHEVGHDHDRALEHPDEQQVLAGVVGRDLRRQLVEPGVDLVLGDEHLLEVGSHLASVHVGPPRRRPPGDPTRTASPATRDKAVPRRAATTRPGRSTGPCPCQSLTRASTSRRWPADNDPGRAPASTASSRSTRRRTAPGSSRSARTSTAPRPAARGPVRRGCRAARRRRATARPSGRAPG